jgi:K(+)-stimulated pyrophosphate-energized sodium pump
MNALNLGYGVTSVIMAVVLYFIINSMLGGVNGAHVNTFALYGCGLIGILLSYVFVWLTKYYTDYEHRPVKLIAEASKTGSATNIITGIAVGMESTALPVVFICLAIFGAYYLGKLALGDLGDGGLYGTAIATMGMLSTCTYVLAMDTFGPITDNAGGIIEMSGAPESVRKTTDKLDACGNTTKALTKGYAVGSAALATFLLFAAYMDEIRPMLAKAGVSAVVDLSSPKIFIAAFIAVMVVFLFSSTTMRSVSKAAQIVIMEVRRQFKAIPGIMEGKAKPNYGECVDIVTKRAIKEMMLPGLIPVVVPLLVGFLLGAKALGGMLMGVIITGLFLAVMLTAGGGAWDNAKKYIEDGNFGGKGSFAHAAAVTGDTVGDPAKDTAGPAINPMIKVVNIVALLIVSYVAMIVR